MIFFQGFDCLMFCRPCFFINLLTSRNCPIEVTDAKCDHLSPCFKNCHFWWHRKSIVSIDCYPVLHFCFSIKHILQCVSFNSLFSIYHFCGWCTPKCCLVVLLPCSFTYYITFNWKLKVHEIIILGINVFLVGSISLHATEQLVQGTMQLCFFLSKDESCDNHSNPSSRCENLDYRVTLMHIWTIKCWKIYTVFSRGKKCILQSKKYSIELKWVAFIYWIYLLLLYVSHPHFYMFYLFTVFISLPHYLHLLLLFRSGIGCASIAIPIHIVTCTIRS